MPPQRHSQEIQQPFSPEQQAVAAITGIAEYALRFRAPTPTEMVNDPISAQTMKVTAPDSLTTDISKTITDDGTPAKYKFTEVMQPRQWTEVRWQDGGATLTKTIHSEHDGSYENGFQVGKPQIITDSVGIEEFKARVQSSFSAEAFKGTYTTDEQVRRDEAARRMIGKYASKTQRRIARGKDPRTIMDRLFDRLGLD